MHNIRPKGKPHEKQKPSLSEPYRSKHSKPSVRASIIQTKVSKVKNADHTVENPDEVPTYPWAWKNKRKRRTIIKEQTFSCVLSRKEASYELWRKHKLKDWWGITWPRERHQIGNGIPAEQESLQLFCHPPFFFQWRWRKRWSVPVVPSKRELRQQHIMLRAM